MKTCEYCGAEIEGAEHRCPNCGAPISEEKKETAAPIQIDPTPPPVQEIPKMTGQSGEEMSGSGKIIGFILLTCACLIFCIVIGKMPDDSPSYDNYDDAAVVDGIFANADTMAIRDMWTNGPSYDYDNEAVCDRNVQYLDAFDNAVKRGKFTNIGDFVERDSAAYKYIKNLVTSRHRTVTHQSWRYLLRRTSYNESSGLIEIESHEKYFFKYRAGGEGYKDIFMTYHVEPSSPYRIKKAERREDPYSIWRQLGKVNGNNVNIRGGASLDSSNILGQAMRNDLVEIYSNETKTGDGTRWLWIRHDKIGLGWISADFVDPVCTQ